MKTSPVRIPDLQMLLSFQDRIKELEREHQAKINQKRNESRKLERLNRKQFKEYVNELFDRGLITRKTLWVDLYESEMKENPLYIALVGQPGSVPIDFIRDVQCRLELEYQDAIHGKIPLDKVNKLIQSDVSERKAEEAQRSDERGQEEVYKMLRKAEPRIRSSDSFREVGLLYRKVFAIFLTIVFR